MCAHGGAVLCKLICMDVALFVKFYGVLFGGRWWLWLDFFEGSLGFHIKTGRVSSFKFRA